MMSNSSFVWHDCTPYVMTFRSTTIVPLEAPSRRSLFPWQSVAPLDIVILRNRPVWYGVHYQCRHNGFTDVYLYTSSFRETLEVTTIKKHFTISQFMTLPEFELPWQRSGTVHAMDPPVPGLGNKGVSRAACRNQAYQHQGRYVIRKNIMETQRCGRKRA